VLFIERRRRFSSTQANKRSPTKAFSWAIGALVRSVLPESVKKCVNMAELFSIVILKNIVYMSGK
jgi:hypothetical protein